MIETQFQERKKNKCLEVIMEMSISTTKTHKYLWGKVILTITS